jgi:uncharacterized protein (DUF305 family)
MALLVALYAFFVTARPAVSEGPAPTRQAVRFEIKFMEGMIDHHAMAVMMAELCLDRAIHPELEELCQEIIETQSAEIAQMQSWLEDWYGIEYEPQMTRKMERQLQELAELSGAEFEVAFLQMMIEHHEAAIKEAQKCVKRAFHDELVALCEGIVQAQSMEITLMETWLCAWYGLCESR